MRVTIIMCEGPHDVAFLSRIIHTIGFHTFSKKINEYPYFIKQFIENTLPKGSLDDLNLQEARGGLFLPSYALFRDDQMVLLYNLGGDSKKQSRNRIITSFSGFFKDAKEGLTNKYINKDDSVTILYCYDADDKGIARRVNEVQDEIADFLFLEKKIDLQNNSFVSVSGIRIGVYVFAEPGTDRGRLEDIVIPMMTNDNEDIKGDVEILINKREQRQYLLFACPDRKKDDDFNSQKAIIGLMGQLEKSGCPNATIIAHGSYVTDEEICKNTSCQGLLDVINKSFE